MKGREVKGWEGEGRGGEGRKGGEGSEVRRLGAYGEPAQSEQ